MPRCPAHLFGGLADFVHVADALGGAQPELLDQESQVDPEALGGLNPATRRRVAKPFFGSSKLGGRQWVVLPHQSYRSPHTRSFAD